MSRTGGADGGYLGVGPGAQTRDGCSVELYRRLPYAGEVEKLRLHRPPPASILEMGCGAGRVTRHLLSAGYRVTAVDNSRDMLAHLPPEAVAVCSDIERLQLGQEFDAVLFASCLVNHPDERERARRLERCHAHLRPGGPLLLERFDPSWLDRVQPGPLGPLGPFAMDVVEARHGGASVEMCLRYRDGRHEWRQSFTATILRDADVDRLLLEAGFTTARWLDARWAVADKPS